MVPPTNQNKKENGGRNEGCYFVRSIMFHSHEIDLERPMLGFVATIQTSNYKTYSACNLLILLHFSFSEKENDDFFYCPAYIILL